MSRKTKRNKQSFSAHPTQESLASGASLARILPQAHSQKSRMIYILTALLLPGLGVHNFYAGYTRNGLIQLLCAFPGIFLIFPFLISVVWTWIEIFTITKDATGLPFQR